MSTISMPINNVNYQYAHKQCQLSVYPNTMSTISMPINNVNYQYAHK